MSKKTEYLRMAKENKNGQIKKTILALILIAIIGVLVYVVFAKPAVEKQDNTAKTFTQVKESEMVEEVNDENISNEESNNLSSTRIGDKEVKITKLKDGTLYSISGESVKPELIIGNNYFDTQLSDVNTNFSTYEGKTVEIEGFFIEDSPFTFVGRYSESNLCAYCPQGYSYFEYEWHGNNQFDFTNEKEWLKIVGTFKRGFDDLGEYYYIDASSIKVMNERGQDTVKN
ncbi:MAG: hypothetical protein IJ220_03720 [Clostridia bacterium]|nr:hypothetical protein [Clostridia bacterium]